MDSFRMAVGLDSEMKKMGCMTNGLCGILLEPKQLPQRIYNRGFYAQWDSNNREDYNMDNFKFDIGDIVNIVNGEKVYTNYTKWISHYAEEFVDDFMLNSFDCVDAKARGIQGVILRRGKHLSFDDMLYLVKVEGRLVLIQEDGISLNTEVGNGMFSVDELAEDVEYTDSKNKYSNLKFKVNDGVLLQADISDLRSHYRVCGISYNDIMDTRFVECEFEPRRNERYYYPSFRNALGYEANEWFGSDNSNRIRRNVGVYRTSNQAREKARELGWLDD